jgi:hypothetical protein
MLQSQVKADTLTSGRRKQIPLFFGFRWQQLKLSRILFRNFLSFEKLLNQNEKNDNIERSNSNDDDN